MSYQVLPAFVKTDIGIIPVDAGSSTGSREWLENRSLYGHPFQLHIGREDLFLGCRLASAGHEYQWSLTADRAISDTLQVGE